MKFKKQKASGSFLFFCVLFFLYSVPNALAQITLNSKEPTSNPSSPASSRLTSQLTSQLKNYRIVSLNPALTEILFALGLGESIVGTTTFSSYPEAAKKISTVGSYFLPHFEKILNLKPTHVLVYKEGEPSIFEFLKKSKIPTLIFNSRSLKDYPKTLTLLGHTFHKPSEAAHLIEIWNSYFFPNQTATHKTASISVISSATKSNPASLPTQKTSLINSPLSLAIQVDHNPLLVAGNDTFLSQALENCGYKNSFSLSGYQKISVESFSLKKPAIILVLGQLNSKTSFAEVQNFWHKNPFTKQSAVILADADSLSRLAPRLPAAVQSLCEHLRSKLETTQL